MDRPSPQIPPNPGRSTPNVGRSMKKSGFLLKKHEFLLLAGAALALFVLVYFLFVPGSDSQAPQSVAGQEAPDLEARLVKIEAALARLTASGDGELTPVSLDPDALKKEVTPFVDRVETRVMLKWDALGDRVAKLEKKLNTLELSMDRIKAAPVAKGIAKTAKKPAASAVPLPARSASKTVVQKVPKNKELKQKAIYHTVKKGETLWRISQKYKISVDRLRKLNKISADGDIFPGSRLRIR